MVALNFDEADGTDKSIKLCCLSPDGMTKCEARTDLMEACSAVVTGLGTLSQ